MNKRIIQSLTTAIVLTFLSVPASAQMGHVLNGVGPIDQGMSGAGMAAPQDALTALHWNPASLFAVPGRSLDIGLQVMKPTGSLASSVQAGGFTQPGGPTFPPAALSGSTDSDAGLFPIPSVGYMHVFEGGRFAYGLSAFGVGGFGVDYALSPSSLATGVFPDNPLLSAQQANGGMGFGKIQSAFMLLQIAPTIAYRINDQISVGVAPTWNMAGLELSVFPATPPATGLYPDAPMTWTTGFGFQVGVHADFDDVALGVSYKSRQNFKDFEFSPEVVTANPDFKFRLDYPAIYSAGIAYRGIDRLLVVADARYLDFENATGFEETGFDPATFAVRGFGWKSVMAFAIGAQYEVSPGIPVRIGYAYNDNPIEDDVSFFNTPAPAIIQHHVSAGCSYRLSERFMLSLAGQYGLENNVTSPWKNPQFPGGSNPATSATSTLSTITVIGGVHISL